MNILCRICLTTEEDEKFKAIVTNGNIAKKIFCVYHMALDLELSKHICAKCEKDLDVAWQFYVRLNDANDYLKLWTERNKVTQTVQIGSKQKTTKVTNISKAMKSNQRSVIYECDTCKKTFASLAILNKHIENHDAFACFFCTKAFSSIDERRQHLEIIHHTEKRLQLEKNQKKDESPKSAAAEKIEIIEDITIIS